MALTFLALALLGLGIASGAALVAVALGTTAIQAGPMLWVLFPLFTLGGFVLLAMGGSLATVRGVTRAAALALLGLALAAAVTLVAAGMGLVAASASSTALWYVLVVAGTAGALGNASFRARGGALPSQRG